MKKVVLRTSLSILTLTLSGCGGEDQTISNVTHVEEMGPMGGNNTAMTPGVNADNAPVGSIDNGNVAPGNANPGNPRPGDTQELSKRQ
jgi:hypothetical protein